MSGENDNIQEVINSVYLGIVKMIVEGKSRDEIMDFFLINDLPKDFIESIYNRALWDVRKFKIKNLFNLLGRGIFGIFLMVLPFILINSALYYFQNSRDQKFIEEMKEEKNIIDKEKQRYEILGAKISKTQKTLERMMEIKNELDSGDTSHSIEYLGLLEMNKSNIENFDEDLKAYESGIDELNQKVENYNNKAKSERKHFYLIPIPRGAKH